MRTMFFVLSSNCAQESPPNHRSASSAAGKPLDVLRRAENVAAVIIPAERGAGKQIQTEIFRGILVHIDLFQHDALFALHLLVGKIRVQKEIGEQRERLSRMIGRRFSIKTREIFARKRIHLRAEGVERIRDLKGRAGGRALELHMLDKMRDPVLLVGLERSARSHENPHRDGEQALHAFDDHAHSAFQRFCFYHCISSLCISAVFPLYVFQPRFSPTVMARSPCSS